MIRKALVICFLLIASFGLKAQPFANGWIDYSQKYYKIKVAQNGIYRIDFATLSNAGISVGPGGINPQNLQLFNKGKQQYIYIEGENDGEINNGDFIEFYGEKNDGALDSLIYYNTSFIPNPYYSLINDTAVYFLTWNNSTSNNRLLPETDVNFAGFPSPSLYFLKDEIQEFHTAYYEGETDFAGGTDVRYTRAEGWFDADGNYDPLLLGGTVVKSVNTKNVYIPGPNANITLVVVGASKNASQVGQGNNDHHINIKYQGNGGFNNMIDDYLKGYEPKKLTYNLSPSLLGNNTTNFQFQSLTSGISSFITDNRTAISFVDVKYPHTLDLEGSNSFLMYTPNAPFNQPKSNFHITNFSASGTVHIYDLSNAKRITVVPNGGGYDALIPNSINGNEKKCYITSDGNITNVTTLLPVSPNAQFTDYAASAVDSAYIIVSHKLLWSSAINYKNYRSTINGGSQNVVLADIDELYDQFAYGIGKSPLSIRGFCDFMIHTASVNSLVAPQNLFLLGKSLHVSWTRQYPPNYQSCLVPSFGNPSSDNLITSGLVGNTIAPAISTGRLSATSTTQVDDYYNKVQQFEFPSNQTGEWKKEVLHFGGGANFSEQNAFKYYLNKYRDTIQDTYYGGNVRSFWKTSSAPIQINTSDTVRDLINNGVSIMNFFGHASGQSFDQSLDDISTYNPIGGHYPFLIANSCYAGDIHVGGGSSSEVFVLTANKGMIGYLGSVSLGVPVALNKYTGELYSQISRKNYGRSIGSAIRKTIFNDPLLPAASALDTNTCFEMTLHGDPAVIISPGAKPDYKITGNDVFFDVTSVPNYIIVSVVRTNLGKATNDTSATQLIRTFPDGTSATYILMGREPYYKDTIKFKLKIDTNNVSGVGLNKFYVTLDRNNTVDEINENNNTTGEVDYIINGGDLIPVYPYEFAIIPTDTVTLKASTANPLAASRNYIFQFDTTDTYNSPFLQTGTITSVGGVVKWKPANFINSDSVVYFWRVSPDSTSPTNGFKWRESSFQYINGKKGWEQAHFFQFKNNTYQYVHFNRPQRMFEFYNDLKVIEAYAGLPMASAEQYKINGYLTYSYPWLQGASGLTIAVFDPISGNPRQSFDYAGNPYWGDIWGNYSGAYTFGTRENAWDFYDSDSTQRYNIYNFLTAVNSPIQNGDYVLAFGSNNSIPQYNSLLRGAFHSLGADGIDSVPANRAYIMFGRKGAPAGSANEIIGDSVSSMLQSSDSINTNWTQGFIKSPIIGPAANSITGWNSLHWRWKTLDGATTKDSIVVKLIGINSLGNESVLAYFPKDSLDISYLWHYVNATQFPYIRLEADMKDDSLHTAPQLKRWHVTFDPVPECAINPAIGGVHFISSDDVQEGDNIIVQLPIQNIGSVAFTTDSLLVTKWVVDANGITHHFPDKLKKKPFLPNEVILDTLSIKTFDSVRFRGNNALWVEVNPVNKPHSQLEQYHFNNIIRIPFRVSGDRVNPLLDVTFDGVHILNSDIVSAKPNIMMKLKDENQYLALNDTNDFKVFLQSPSSPIAKRVWFGSDMSFVPAILPNNSCRINYTPVLHLDGTYQLIVQAKDISNNQSGAVDYKISFEVINKATITEVMNYPNPFTTSTRFVFTLTGSELPSNFKIQVMTITGKVVKEIFQDELGYIHIGRNITEYVWDGRDEFGDRLANGVYLYRVMTKLNGEDIEKRETEADQYFKKGWGKMYLMH